MMWRRWLLLVLGVVAPVSACLADGGGESSGADATAARPNAILVFAGRLSTTDFASTVIFDLRYTPEEGRPSYDNDIAGVEYERDLLEVAPDVRMRAEGGMAERFGHYLVCCMQNNSYWYRDMTVRLNGRVYSTEVWAGGKLRWQNLHAGDGVKFELALTVGLSGVSRTIGRERQREIDNHGNAHILGYVSPEIGMSLDRLPNFELVARVPHRSGAGGTFGHMEEGYNANVVGVRYIF